MLSNEKGRVNLVTAKGMIENVKGTVDRVTPSCGRNMAIMTGVADRARRG